MSHKKFWLVATAILVFITGCALAPTRIPPTAVPSPKAIQPTATATPVTKKLRAIGLQLPWRKNGESAVFFVAKKAGYFEAEGLDVSFIEGGPGVPAHINLLSGAQNVQVAAFASDGALIPLLAGDPPLPFVIVGAVLQQHPLGFVILESKLNPEQKARPLKPEDLKGKTVGVQGEQEILALLAKNGMKREDVNIVTIAGENPADLLTQRVDYASYWVVNQPLGLKEPWKALMFSQWGVPFYGDIIAVKKETATKDPELVRAFMRALTKAMQKTLDEPDYAIKAILENSQAETEELLKKRIPLQNSMMKGTDAKVRLGWMDLGRVVQTIKFYEDTKQIKPGILDAKQIMDVGFLP